MASSGTVNTGYQNYTRFYLSWRLVDQDITNNRSLISWEIGVQGTSGYTAYWYSNAVRINSGYVNGDLVSGSATYSNITLSGAEKHKLRSGSIWVGHSSDGSKSFSASVSGWLYGNNNTSASGSWSLPTIPRNSQVSTNATSYDLGDAIQIITNRKSSSFTHTITIRLFNSSGTVLQTINNVGSSTTWTPTSTQIETMQDAIPNSNNLTLYIRSYNNQVKDDSTVTRTLKLTDANPIYDDFTFKDTDATTVSVTGNDQVFVKGKSVLEVKIPSAEKMTAVKGATENYYAIAYDGTSNQVNYSTSDITSSFSSMLTSGTRTILVTAYDSRSNTTRVSKDITVYNYAAPTISTTLTRENNFGANTTIHIEGTYTPLVIGGTAKNAIQTGTVQYRYKEDGGSFGSWVTKTFTANSTNGTFSVTDFVVSLDNSKKYIFEFRVDDKFGTITTGGVVEVGTPIVFIGQNNGTAALSINSMPADGAKFTIDGVNFLEFVYPIGSIYINRTNPANPSSLLGFGTWNKIEDKMIMSRGTSYTSDGGSGTHTHPLSQAGGVPFYLDSSNTYVNRDGPTPDRTVSRANRTTNVGWSGSVSGNITNSLGLVGNTDSASTIPPMIVAYIWERTA